MSRLDQLAYDVATSVNTAHHAGFDLNGNPGGDFFTAAASASAGRRRERLDRVRRRSSPTGA